MVDNTHPLYEYIIFPKFAENKFNKEYRNPLTTGTYSGYILKIDKQ